MRDKLKIGDRLKNLLQLFILGFSFKIQKFAMLLLSVICLFFLFTASSSVYVSSNVQNIQECGEKTSPCSTIASVISNFLGGNDSESIDLVIKAFALDAYIIPPSFPLFTKDNKTIHSLSFSGLNANSKYENDTDAYVSFHFTSVITFPILSFDRINFLLQSSTFNFGSPYVFLVEDSLTLNSVSIVGQGGNTDSILLTKSLIFVQKSGYLVLKNSVITGINFTNSSGVSIGAGGSAEIVGTTFYKIQQNGSNGAAINAIITNGSSLNLVGAHFLTITSLDSTSKGGALFVELAKGGWFVVSGLDQNPSLFDNLDVAGLGGGIYLKLADDYIHPTTTNTSFYFENGSNFRFYRANAKYGKHIFLEAHNLMLFTNSFFFHFDTYAPYLTDPLALVGINRDYSNSTASGGTNDYIPLFRYLQNDPCRNFYPSGGVCPHGCFISSKDVCDFDCPSGETSVNNKCEVIPKGLSKVFNKKNMVWIIVVGALAVVTLVLLIVTIVLCCQRCRSGGQNGGGGRGGGGLKETKTIEDGVTYHSIQND